MNNFVCVNCGRQVSGEALGTQNRNHCPFCLYSLHLDLHKPGDRLSVCHGLMRPLGLSNKADGEICLVHRCQKCGALNKNRLAGDDEADQVLAVYRQSINQPVKGIALLAKDAEREIITQLFGAPYAKKYFASLA
jgi:hypothetical protein